MSVSKNSNLDLSERHHEEHNLDFVFAMSSVKLKK